MQIILMDNIYIYILAPHVETPTTIKLEYIETQWLQDAQLDVDYND